MNKEDKNNDLEWEEGNHTYIEVLNSNGDIKLTKLRNPQAIWQNNEYPDEYVFRDVDYINIFQLIQENKQLKSIIKTLMKEYNLKPTEYVKNLLKGDRNEYNNKIKR